MPRSHLHDETPARTARSHPDARYLIVRREDLWFIKFDGGEYGPYRTEREAMLFAIEAAEKLGEHGEETQVLLTGDHGESLAAWAYGQHRYRC